MSYTWAAGLNYMWIFPHLVIQIENVQRLFTQLLTRILLFIVWWNFSLYRIIYVQCNFYNYLQNVNSIDHPAISTAIIFDANHIHICPGAHYSYTYMWFRWLELEVSWNIMCEWLCLYNIQILSIKGVQSLLWINRKHTCLFDDIVIIHSS